MNSLFSVFDPSSLGGELNWFMGFSMLMLSISLFGSQNFMHKIFLKLMYLIHLDVMISFGHQRFSGQSMVFLSLFLIISWINFWGLFPFIFTPSSHLSFAMMLAIFMWFGSQLFNWISRPEVLLAHLVPEGTPFMLMPFLVLIEMVSNLIRPLTLSIRLVANMSAGHLLLSLLGSAMSLDNLPVLLFMMAILLMFIILEMSVAFIQSYVFMSLSSLYVKEVE